MTIVVTLISSSRADWIHGLFSPKAGIDSINRVMVIRDTKSEELFGAGLLTLGDINSDGAPDLWISRQPPSLYDTDWSFAYYGGLTADDQADRTFTGFFW